MMFPAAEPYVWGRDEIHLNEEPAQMIPKHFKWLARALAEHQLHLIGEGLLYL